MWWYLKKTEDNEHVIEYSYGCQTRDVSGVIKYEKMTEESRCMKLAEGDTEKGVSVLLDHVWDVVNKENAPAERLIAIG